MPAGHARLVLLQDVRDLMADDGGELGLGLRDLDEAAVDADVPADQREGVDRVFLHDEEIDVLARAAFGRGEEARAERRDVVGDLRVVHVRRIDAHLAHDPVADGALLRLRKRRGGGVSEIGKRDLGRCRGTDERRGAEEGGDEANVHGREFEAATIPL
jgi:hypothetical protein